ncbi:SDR family oxidoreductase [Sphingomonas koreensis]|nr:SDR family oxidoreductase [Sphingomonas koreensis]
MDLQLTGKCALVTGSSIGIGKQIARTLATEGATVVVHGRDRERADSVAADIVSTGGKAIVVTGDLTDDGQVEELCALLGEQLGCVDILVNNAGGSGEKHKWGDTAVEAWADAYNRNVLAAVRLTNRLLPGMRTARWGRIINISSMAGTMPPSNGPDYSACKAAMNNLTLSLAKSAAADGITVNAVSPGTVFTPKLEEAFRDLAAKNGWADHKGEWSEVERAVLPHVAPVPIGRVGMAGDIANAVAFLCSPLAGYITGVDLRIDGGMMPAL